MPFLLLTLRNDYFSCANYDQMYGGKPAYCIQGIFDTIEQAEKAQNLCPLDTTQRYYYEGGHVRQITKHVIKEIEANTILDEIYTLVDEYNEIK